MISLASLVHRGQQPWIFMAAVVFVVLMGMGVVLGPIRGRFQELNEAIVIQEQKAARNLRVLSPASKEAAVSEYQELGNTIPRRGSTAEEVASMLAEIEKQATDTGVILSTTKQRDPNVQKDFEEYRVDLEVEADMKQLVGFLYGLESSAQLLRAERVALDVKGGGERGVFRGSLTVSKVVTL
ncbi:MAG: GspMb/PilO family protein [bacterium]